MTEIVAAHLERVARELAELNYVLSLQMPRGPDDEPLAEMSIAYAQGALVPLLTKQQVEAIMPVVAAALAACAREAQIQGRNQGIAHCLLIVQNSRSTDEHVNWLLKKLADTMGEALERAVGEKAAGK